MPVSCVTRSQAAAFCAFEKGALPTAEQWEKAARGVRGSLFPWGDAWSPNVANWGEVDVIQTLVLGRLDGHEWVAPAASFDDGKSPFGIYDMAGNVAEWVAGEDQVTGEVRGGAWSSLPFDLRTTVRQELSIDMRRADVGFRCAYP
jgi:formylglycine-generating enzyme required for sulfatase activity